MLGIPHPYLTAGLSGVGGIIKQDPQDFVVEEVPLYTPCDRGEHTYFEIEKRDLSTLEALERLASALRLPPRDLGYAGLKDRKGVTRQVISVGRIPPEEILALRIPQLEVLWARRHTNKLRVGHLRGNRFRIVIRGVEPSPEKIEGIFAALRRTGVPNYYGPQRFGNRGDAHRVGRAFLKRDDEGAVRRILGHPAVTEHNPNVVRAREHFMAGELQDARDAFPSTYREERKLLNYLLEPGATHEGARKRLSDTSRKLYCTAYQSFLFNVCLSERLARLGGDLGRFETGDLAFIHRNGAVFQVEDPAAEATRAEAFEVSPSGPIFGKKMPRPTGLEGEIESSVLEREGLRVEDFHQLMPRLKLEGGRRPYRVRVEDLAWELEGVDLRVQFFLPKGSYATTVLRELTKNETVPEAFYEQGDEERFHLWRHTGPSLPPGELASLPE